MKPNNEHDETFAEDLGKLVAENLGAVLFLTAYDEHNIVALSFLDGYFRGLLAKIEMDDPLSVSANPKLQIIRQVDSATMTNGVYR